MLRGGAEGMVFRRKGRVRLPARGSGSPIPASSVDARAEQLLLLDLVSPCTSPAVVFRALGGAVSPRGIRSHRRGCVAVRPRLADPRRGASSAAGRGGPDGCPLRDHEFLRPPQAEDRRRNGVHLFLSCV